jgi:hypothetical protein
LQLKIFLKKKEKGVDFSWILKILLELGVLTYPHSQLLKAEGCDFKHTMSFVMGILDDYLYCPVFRIQQIIFPSTINRLQGSWDANKHQGVPIDSSGVTAIEALPGTGEVVWKTHPAMVSKYRDSRGSPGGMGLVAAFLFGALGEHFAGHE